MHTFGDLGLRRAVGSTLRTIGRRKGLAAAVVLVAALGVAGAGVTFSVAWNVAFRALGYDRPGELLDAVESQASGAPSTPGMSIGTYAKIRSEASTIAGVALIAPIRRRTLAGEPGNEVTSRAVSPQFFRLLGVRLLAGSDFQDESTYAGRAARDVIVSYGAWVSRFGRSVSAVGQAIRYSDDAAQFRIVGVLPEGFTFPDGADFWHVKAVGDTVPPGTRALRLDRAIVRIKAGSSAGAVASELATLADALSRDFPSSNDGWTIRVQPFSDAVLGRFHDVAPLLLAASALIAILVCANVGGLRKLQSETQGREIAIRRALGATGWSLVRAWIAESLLLSGVAAMLGVALTNIALHAIRESGPIGLPRQELVSLDGPTMMACTTVALLVFFVLLLVPVRSLMNGTAEMADAAHWRVGRCGNSDSVGVSPAAVQCGVSVIAVFSGLLLTWNLLSVLRVETGWRADGVLSMQVTPPEFPGVKRPWFARAQWAAQIVREVDSASSGRIVGAVATDVPLSSPSAAAAVSDAGAMNGVPTARILAGVHRVSDGYFGLLGIRLLRGRLFDSSDGFTESQINQYTPAASGVVVLTRAAADALWPNEEALGRTIRVQEVDNVPVRRVIGVVDDLKFSGLNEPPMPQVFVPVSQQSAGTLSLFLRCDGCDSRPLEAQALIARVAPGATVLRVVSLPTLLERATAQQRFLAMTANAFSLAALVLAGWGIFATVSFLVSAKMHEFAVKAALGATASRLGFEVLRTALLPGLVGVLCGSVALVAARPWLANWYGPSWALFWVALPASVTVVALATLLAAVRPAVMASRARAELTLRSQ